MVFEEVIKIFALDPYIWAFLEGNTITLFMVLGLLKGLAKLTPSVTDDAIITLLYKIIPKPKKNGNGENKT